MAGLCVLLARFAVRVCVQVRGADAKQRVCIVWAGAALGWPGCRTHASSKLFAMAADDGWRCSLSVAAECDERLWELNVELTDIVAA